jgi:flavodoxin short chain
MAKALIVFGSTTGNTATVARQIGHIFTQEGIDVRIQNVRTTKTEEVGRSFDITLLGASSRGNIDTIAFQEDFAPFYEDIRKADIKNKKVAFFGCGDSTREYFCGAVDLLQEKIGDLGGIVVNEPLRVDGDPQAALATIIQWALDVASETCRESAPPIQVD